MGREGKRKREIPYPYRVRVGGGGGIGCPEAVRAAFELGAAFVVTGSVNQITKESGSSDYVRAALAKASYSDVTMAPAADMFEEGVELQVLKKGTFFPGRAHALRTPYRTYDSLESLERAGELPRLEKKILGSTVDAVWAETKRF